MKLRDRIGMTSFRLSEPDFQCRGLIDLKIGIRRIIPIIFLSNGHNYSTIKIESLSSKRVILGIIYHHSRGYKHIYLVSKKWNR
jgi:hypothetical protein